LIPSAVACVALAVCPLTPAATGQRDFTAFDKPARELLAKMTLEEKVGQMCQPDQANLKSAGDVEKFFLGSLLSGGGSGPKNKADYTLQGWTDMVDGYQQHALKTRLGIPLLYGVDAVHGHNNIPGATVFPHNIGLGCADDAALVEKIERPGQLLRRDVKTIIPPCRESSLTASHLGEGCVMHRRAERMRDRVANDRQRGAWG